MPRRTDGQTKRDGQTPDPKTRPKPAVSPKRPVSVSQKFGTSSEVTRDSLSKSLSRELERIRKTYEKKSRGGRRGQEEDKNGWILDPLPTSEMSSLADSANLGIWRELPRDLSGRAGFLWRPTSGWFSKNSFLIPNKVSSKVSESLESGMEKNRGLERRRKPISEIRNHPKPIIPNPKPITTFSPRFRSNIWKYYSQVSPLGLVNPNFKVLPIYSSTKERKGR